MPGVHPRSKPSGAAADAVALSLLPPSFRVTSSFAIFPSFPFAARPTLSPVLFYLSSLALFPPPPDMCSDITRFIGQDRGIH